MDPIFIPWGQDFFGGTQVVALPRFPVYALGTLFLWLVLTVTAVKCRRRFNNVLTGWRIFAGSIVCLLLVFAGLYGLKGIDDNLNYHKVLSEAPKIETDWQECSSKIQEVANNFDIAWKAARQGEASYGELITSRASEEKVRDKALEYVQTVIKLREAEQEFHRCDYQIRNCSDSFQSIAIYLRRFGERSDDGFYLTKAQKYFELRGKAQGLSAGSEQFYRQYVSRDEQNNVIEELIGNLVELQREIDGDEYRLKQKKAEDAGAITAEKDLQDKINLLAETAQAILRYRLAHPVLLKEKPQQ